MYHLLNNLAMDVQFVFPDSIMNIFMFVITLTLSSIDNAYNSSSMYILFPL